MYHIIGERTVMVIVKLNHFLFSLTQKVLEAFKCIECTFVREIQGEMRRGWRDGNYI